MADAFLSLSADDKREALEFAAARSGRPAHLLEKDVWVVWALAALFESPLSEHLVFKGGTSLSKAYKVIRRFSEDVDVTYDIRALAPDLVGGSEDAIPTTRADERRWSSDIRKRLPVWVAETALPIVTSRLNEADLAVKTRAEAEKIFVAFEPIAAGFGYVRPEVMLEFGARSTGEPSALREVGCDAAEWVDGIVFPTARPRVMNAERTFWEKATAIHVYCAQQRVRGERISRHWHDIARLDEAGVAGLAIADRDLARAVARHKNMFFAENDVDKRPIDYHRAVGGGLRLVPEGAALKALADDYAKMVDDGLLLEEGEAFDALMTRCQDLQDRANTIRKPAGT